MYVAEIMYIIIHCVLSHIVLCTLHTHCVTRHSYLALHPVRTSGLLGSCCCSYVLKFGGLQVAAGYCRHFAVNIAAGFVRFFGTSRSVHVDAIPKLCMEEEEDYYFTDF